MSARFDERTLRDTVLRAVSGLGARLFRQNVGLAWVGGEVSKFGDSVMIRHARPLRAGLCEGSSDLIGWTPVTITPDMIGQDVAVFTALELKTGRIPVTAEQEHFLAAVRSAGGIAAVVRGTADAVQAIKAARHAPESPTASLWSDRIVANPPSENSIRGSRS